ncbi:Retrovirus Polyprotein [Phytophthora palmivora]|uniref:Retrovirus Polyprotein n=1 Tax=Phytophthora palmivora TaxID=4796 RepID=A0A2P4YVI6_9STRA|nr:Retrovirus Polyprotein [Phytophthora palmivora]
MLKGPTKTSISWTDDLHSHFLSLKAKIASPPVLAIPDFGKPFRLRMDASDHAIGGVLFQEEVRGDELVERPIPFGGRKYKDGENNYSIREKELLAILFGLRLWRVNLLDKPFVVETDHRSRETIFTQKTISRRVARWYGELSEYPITFRYIRGDTNTVADAISRRPDFMRGATTTLTAITSRKEICKHIDRALARLVKVGTDRYADDSFTSSLVQQLSGRVTPDKPSIRHYKRYSMENKQIYYQALSDEQPRLVLPNITEIIDALLYEFHDAKCYGHPGIETTILLVEKDYYWRYMERSVPLDFIVALPETKEGFDSIMAVIDRLAKRAHFLPTTTIATTLEIAELYRDRVFVLHGIPEEVLSDRDSKFTSALWTELCAMLGAHQKLTSAFRQQANGVTERLRAFTNSNSNDWDAFLSLAEIAYNSRYQASIGTSPFKADFGYQPATPASPRTTNEVNQAEINAESRLVIEFVEQQNDILARVRRQLQAAQDRMSSYYDQNRPTQNFNVGDQVLLSTTNLANFHAETTKKKLGPRWIGPYSVVEHVGHDYYRLELPTRVKFHPFFHTSLFKPHVVSKCADQIIFKVSLPDGGEGELVEDIVGYRRRKGKKEYYVKWLGESKPTWEPEGNLEYVQDLITRYHQHHFKTRKRGK